MKHLCHISVSLVFLCVSALAPLSATAETAAAKFYPLDKARAQVPGVAGSLKQAPQQFIPIKKNVAQPIALASNDTKSFSLKKYQPQHRESYALQALAPAAAPAEAANTTEEVRTVKVARTQAVQNTQDGPRFKVVSLDDAINAFMPSNRHKFRTAGDSDHASMGYGSGGRAGPGTRIRHQWPVDLNAKQYISSLFGMRDDPFSRKPAFHAGVDIAAQKGTAVLASAPGIVTDVSTHRRLGHFVKLTHADGTYSLYGHLSAAHVKKGDKIRQGQHIAAIGSTGRSTGNHLDYSLRINDKPVDPLRYLTPPRKVQLAMMQANRGGE